MVAAMLDRLLHQRLLHQIFTLSIDGERYRMRSHRASRAARQGVGALRDGISASGGEARASHRDTSGEEPCTGRARRWSTATPLDVQGISEVNKATEGQAQLAAAISRTPQGRSAKVPPGCPGGASLRHSLFGGLLTLGPNAEVGTFEPWRELHCRAQTPVPLTSTASLSSTHRGGSGSTLRRRSASQQLTEHGSARETWSTTGLRVMFSGGSLELECDEGLIAHNPRVVASFDDVSLSRTEIRLGSVDVAEIKVAGNYRTHMALLTALRAGNWLDAL